MTYFKDESKSYIAKLKEYITLLERTEVGQPYIDFTMNNIEGEAVALSDLIGDNELLMIDFWAAWCPDCRAENPNIVAVYIIFLVAKRIADVTYYMKVYHNSAVSTYAVSFIIILIFVALFLKSSNNINMDPLFLRKKLINS